MQIMKDLSLLQLQMRKEEGQALGYVVRVPCLFAMRVLSFYFASPVCSVFRH